MVAKPIELFYSYAHENKSLRDKLDTHLKLLERDKLIAPWHDRNITAGSLWASDIDEHLKTARIILLLVSADFIASDYCWNIELAEALKRHEAGKACVIPVILEPCDWERTPFGKLQALPEGGKPVTMWPNRNAAFTSVAKGIRSVVDQMNGVKKLDGTAVPEDNKKRIQVEEGGRRGMARTPQNIEKVFLKKVTNQYYAELKGYQEVANYELGLRAAFQNMLSAVAKYCGWSLAPEMTIDKIRPDGVILDEFRIRRGYWEAKGPKVDLEAEIKKKIAVGYPLTNTVFEDSKRAVLFQGKRRTSSDYDMSDQNRVIDLLRDFFTYVEPDIENFEEAVDEFKEQIPQQAQGLLNIVKDEHKLNKKFRDAFTVFSEVCRTSLDPKMTDETIDEMLIQHLLTERLFRTVFDNPDFVSRNVIASEIEKVIQALTSRSFNRHDFLKSLDRFYVAIEGAAKGIEDWSERQDFLNTVYERFFQGFAIKQADTHGIVYTPQEIVDFMCSSVEEVLQKEFGKSISDQGVRILDPATGTGNFIVNLIRNHIKRRDLMYKYKNDLFCNEIMLLPYYIASLNIEHEYYERTGQYEPFDGICFADTLTLAEGRQLSLFVEENTERVQREKNADIMVVIGNPPYNVGQKNENDNNKNRKYDVIDKSVSDTYAKDSKASNKNALSDPYVKFFRWAVDRLQGRDGIVCLVTNNSFIDQIAFDGMRKHLQKDFNQIYHLDLHGNVRKNPKLSGTTHNVFGIQVGVGITIAVRNTSDSKRVIKYYRVPEGWRKTEKLEFLKGIRSLATVDWLDLCPDERYAWITDGLQAEFSTFLSIGGRNTKAMRALSGGAGDIEAIFKDYSPGAQTNRDNWMYDFDRKRLEVKAKSMIETYDAELSRWVRAGMPKDVDNFVTYDEKKIKWCSRLKECFARKMYADFTPSAIRSALYRPYTRQFLYFDSIMTHRPGMFAKVFPIPETESENVVLCVSGVGADHQTFFVANSIVDVKCGINGNSTVQCFPFYTYSTDGCNRRENITDWVLKQFQGKYGSEVTKWDIFYYIYAMLHHPQYRELYRENLKRDLPRIPLIHNAKKFQVCVATGEQLMHLHLNYETMKEYPLEWFENENVPLSWRIEKMRLSTDKRVVVVNESLRVGPLPQQCFEYRLGNRSALEWVIDQYQVSTDKRSGIESDPNSLDDPEYIVRLVGKVITVSVETVKLVKELEQTVKLEDWLSETVKLDENMLAPTE